MGGLRLENEASLYRRLSGRRAIAEGMLSLSPYIRLFTSIR